MALNTQNITSSNDEKIRGKSPKLPTHKKTAPPPMVRKKLKPKDSEQK
jgi:hypothetical protein